MISLIDTHCHIHFSEYDYENITLELQEAHEVGVYGMVAVSTDIKTSQESIDFAAQHDAVWPVIGIHPHEASQTIKNGLLEQFDELAAEHSDEIVGFGECGLDYFYEHSSRKDQIAVLEHQLQLAVQHNKPVTFHVRDAFDDFWPVLANFPEIKGRGVLHSFTDSPENIKIAAEYGLYIGINGIITFSRDELWRKALQSLPLETIVLETDAPYLTPKPYRGKINKLAYVRIVAEAVADLQSTSLQQVADVTTHNAQKLFGIHL
jgi:TatD DNase family protein